MTPRDLDDKHNEPDADELSRSGDLDAEGDFRGPYGYGRPAHRPDPSGHYRFEPHSVRPLPANPKIRWR